MNCMQITVGDETSVRAFSGGLSLPSTTHTYLERRSRVLRHLMLNPNIGQMICQIYFFDVLGNCRNNKYKRMDVYLCAKKPQSQ